MLKQQLQRWPGVYEACKGAYYSGFQAAERHVFGTSLQELRWRIRSLWDSASHSHGHRHRALLLERLAKFAPLESVLEVGCNSGPNFVALRRQFPGIRLSGIDISGRAIRTARVELPQHGIHDAAVEVGRADDLKRFADVSVDCGFSDATLMYVGPDRIDRAIAEIVRVSRKGVVLNEWHLPGGAAAGSDSQWFYGHWLHDYAALLRGQARVRSVTVERLPADLYGGGRGGWQLYGTLITAHL